MRRLAVVAKTLAVVSCDDEQRRPMTLLVKEVENSLKLRIRKTDFRIVVRQARERRIETWGFVRIVRIEVVNPDEGRLGRAAARASSGPHR